MSEHLPPQARKELKEVGWTKGLELAKVAWRDGQEFDCATWLHKARSLLTGPIYEIFSFSLRNFYAHPAKLRVPPLPS